MEIQDILLDLIDFDKEQPRKNFNGIVELADSIARHGQLEPIKLIKKEDGRYLLEDGERRFRAIKLLKRKTIKAIAKAGKKKIIKKRFIRQLVTNFQKNKLNPIEQSDAIIRLHKEGLTSKEIQVNLGISEYKLNLLMKLAGLTNYSKQQILKGNITQSMISQLSKSELSKDREEEIVKYLVKRKIKSVEKINRAIFQKSDIRYNVTHYLNETYKFHLRTEEMNVLLGKWEKIVEEVVKDKIKFSNDNLNKELEIIRDKINLILKSVDEMTKNAK